MEALIASYGDDSSDSDSDVSLPSKPDSAKPANIQSPVPLPPPPISLLTPPPCSIGAAEYFQPGQPSRLRSFPHVEGNYALHVYIPVHIPPASKKQVAQFLKKISLLVPDLHVVDADVPLSSLCKDEQKLEQVAVGREFHVSLGRTVAIRVHQIDSVVAMLRQKLQSQKRYWIDFNKWEVFVNDDQTRTFLSIEVVTGGLAEITKQIHSVNEVYKLHNLPEFYKDPRPHISLAWALGDISDSLKRVVVEEEVKRSRITGRVFTCKFSGIVCKIGNKTFKICKLNDD
ncbi:U6 snRNA phosphodiesterase 1 [Linum perenne]